ncbi:hypothetical protein [Paraburkholderia sp. C35]|uniref:hypothetical protein n=1 Tax=Paraburkholderia sp. C35 TaxID=2126993 RepID=UPI0013A54E0C|nr:hypothetical protein [Paraburkholderia sp. C35]
MSASNPAPNPSRTEIAAPASPLSGTDGALQAELERLLNEHSRENASNTPDFILAKYMISCLEAFEAASRERESWFGRNLSI